MTLAPDDPRHGTANGYSNYRCRCAACREAWRVAHMAYELPLGSIDHGELERRCPRCT